MCWFKKKGGGGGGKRKGGRGGGEGSCKDQRDHICMSKQSSSVSTSTESVTFHLNLMVEKFAFR